MINTTLGEIADIITGPFGSQLHMSDYVDEGIAVIMPQNIGDRIILEDKIARISESDYKRLKKYQTQKEDIVYSRRGDVEKHAFISGDKPYLCGTGCLRVRANKEKVYPRYLSLFLSRPETKRWLSQHAIGSNMMNVNTSILGKVPVFLPDKNTQFRIAETLQNIDDKIQLNIEIIKEIDEMAKLFYNYWLLQFEFPNKDGKPYKSSGGKMVWNEELKREIPEGWKCVQLGEIFSFVKGKIPEKLVDEQKEGLYPYITIDVANDAKAQYCSKENMVYCNGEVIMVMDGAASGDVYMGNYGILGSTFAMMKRKRADISNALIYRILSWQSVVYKKANTGSTVPHANRIYIEKIKIPISRDMEKFSEIFDRIYEKVIQNKRENKELIALRDFLLPLLMNGQVGFNG